MPLLRTQMIPFHPPNAPAMCLPRCMLHQLFNRDHLITSQLLTVCMWRGCSCVLRVLMMCCYSLLLYIITIGWLHPFPIFLLIVESFNICFSSGFLVLSLTLLFINPRVSFSVTRGQPQPLSVFELHRAHSGMWLRGREHHSDPRHPLPVHTRLLRARSHGPAVCQGNLPGTS